MEETNSDKQSIAENENPEEKDLALFQVLLSTFIKEPTTNFQSDGDSLTDQSGTIFSIFTENGITYITRGNSRTPKKRNKKFKDTFILPSSESQNEELEEFTNILKSYTEEVNDIKITEFSLTWGIIDNDQIPYLINCDGSKFTSTSSSKPFLEINTQIVLFNAIEISRVPIPGKCFINQKGCFLTCEKSLIRHKLLQPKIDKFISQFSYDKQSLEKYILNRLNFLCPTLLRTIVPVCKRCYSKYSESSINRKSNLQLSRANPSSVSDRSTPRLNVPLKRNVKNSADSRISSTRKSATDTKSPRKNSSIVKNANSSYLKYTHDPQSVTARAMYFNRFTRKSPSGLTYSQNFSDVSVYRAHRLYSSFPFQISQKPC